GGSILRRPRYNSVHKLSEKQQCRVSQLSGVLARLLRERSITTPRSEERRVGKECRSRWSPDHDKKNQCSAQVHRSQEQGKSQDQIQDHKDQSVRQTDRQEHSHNDERQKTKKSDAASVELMRGQRIT